MATEAPAMDVLAEPLFTITGGAGRERVSLPALLARLLGGPEVIAFPELAPEQRGYWWRFLVRCAAKALHELDRGVDGADAAELEATLRDLVPEGGWCLWQPDPARPGFQQVPCGGLDGYESRPVSLLTGALGAKNHERKSASQRSLTPEQAAYALVEYQTAVIYGGAGNYGSVLQGSASGAGSGTPFMGARLAGSNGLTFRHDVAVLLRSWPALATAMAGSTWAVWSEPWSGEKGSELPTTELDPAFIPLARKVRLTEPEHGAFTHVWFQSTRTRRLLDHTEGGVLGDPFCPTVQDPKPKVRGTLAKGYDYKEVVLLLFGGEKGAERSPSVDAAVRRAADAGGELSVLFEGVAYEQGKTVGFHRREVLLPSVETHWFSEDSPVRDAHAKLLPLVKEVQTALRGAARIVLSGDPKQRPSDAKKVEAPAAQLEAEVDQVYLHHLFRAARQLDADPLDRIETELLDWLEPRARAALREAMAAMPCNTNQRLEREVRAEAFLSGRLKRLRGDAPHEETVHE